MDRLSINELSLCTDNGVAHLNIQKNKCQSPSQQCSKVMLKKILFATGSLFVVVVFCGMIGGGGSYALWYSMTWMK